MYKDTKRYNATTFNAKPNRRNRNHGGYLDHSLRLGHKHTITSNNNVTLSPPIGKTYSTDITDFLPSSWEWYIIYIHRIIRMQAGSYWRLFGGTASFHCTIKLGVSMLKFGIFIKFYLSNAAAEPIVRFVLEISSSELDIWWISRHIIKRLRLSNNHLWSIHGTISMNIWLRRL